MKRGIVGILILILAACGIDPPNTRTTVYIRNAGEVQTTYELDEAGKMRHSTSTDRSGTVVTRRYFYDDEDELESVTRETQATWSETVFSHGESGRSSGNRRSFTSKSMVDGKGSTTVMDIEYFYTEDGALDGIMQTDEYGNVQAKCVED
jgi:hypothetical protein